MYIIYTAQLGDNLPPCCKIIKYADVCLFSSLALLEAAIRVKEWVNKVDKTLQTLGLEISPQKTNSWFSVQTTDTYAKNEGGKTEKDCDYRWSIKVRDYVVPNLEEVKFLGLPLHAVLKWKWWQRWQEKWLGELTS
jgi:hypothetical protein